MLITIILLGIIGLLLIILCTVYSLYLNTRKAVDKMAEDVNRIAVSFDRVVNHSRQEKLYINTMCSMLTKENSHHYIKDRDKFWEAISAQIEAVKKAETIIHNTNEKEKLSDN